MVGYSHRMGRLAAFKVGSTDDAPIELQDSMFRPAPSEEALRLSGWTYQRLFEVERDGVTIMQAQRLTSYPFDDGSTGCGIGGHIQHTIVTPDQITTQIIHRWDDRIGQKIAAG